MRLGVVLAAALACIGCGSLASTAASYSDAGMHELAAEYWAAAHFAAPRDADPGDKMSRAVEAACASLDADIAKLHAAGKDDQALGLALRKEDVVRRAASVGVRTFDPHGLAASTAAVSTGAAEIALRHVDDAESANAPTDVLLGALRVAQGYKPDDPELANRYERARQKAMRNVAYTVTCRGAAPSACRMFAAQLVSSVLSSDTELVQLVPAGSNMVNAFMQIEVDTSLGEAPWHTLQSGKVDGEVQRLNRFREGEVDGQRRPVMDRVSATYTVSERQSNAAIRAQVTVRDASQGQAVLFQAAPTRDKKDVRTYIDYRGDERALGDLLHYGTSQQSPAPATDLALQLARELGTETAKQIVQQLDRSH